MIRRDLKAAFPGFKFYVRSGGGANVSSIDVAWADGPTSKQVDAVIGVYSSKSFDGMTDSSTYHYHWLLPDGSVQYAEWSGEFEVDGNGFKSRKYNPPVAGAELVSLLSNYVHGQRTESPDLVRRVKDFVAEETGWDFSGIKVLESKGYLSKSKNAPSGYLHTESYSQESREAMDWANRVVWATPVNVDGSVSDDALKVAFEQVFGWHACSWNADEAAAEIAAEREAAVAAALEAIRPVAGFVDEVAIRVVHDVPLVEAIADSTREVARDDEAPVGKNGIVPINAKPSAAKVAKFARLG